MSRTSTHVGPDPGQVLWAVAGACWLLLVGVGVFAPALAHQHGAVIQARSGEGWVMALITFVAAAAVMVAAMMLPTIVPMARTFTLVTGRVEYPAATRTVFFAAYFVVWLYFAGVALVGDAGAHAAVVASDWLRTRDGLVLAGVLGLAGVVQFLPLTRCCLRACRDPRAFLFQHYRRGLAASWALGVRHGLCCLGAHWGLMLVMFAVGVGNLWWMVVVTAVMVVESTARRGMRLVAPVGVALLAAALWLGLSELVPSPLDEVNVPAHDHH
jgi:predicted metal-binding membrane protein